MLLIPVQFARSPSSDRPTPERETALAHHRRRRRLFLQSPSSSSSRRTSTKTTTNTSKTTTLDTPRRRDDRVGIASSQHSPKDDDDDDDVGVDDAHHRRRRRRRPSRERTRASSSSSYSSPSPSPSSACLARDRPPVVRFGSVPRASRADDFDPRPDPRPETRFAWFFFLVRVVRTYCARKHPHERPRFGFRRPRTTARTPCRSESPPGLIFPPGLKNNQSMRCTMGYFRTKYVWCARIRGGKITKQ